jgi:hypothetical protein
MKKMLSAVVMTILMIAGTVALTAAPVSADTPRCVTVKEYRQVYKGMKKWRVHRIFDTRGEASGGFAGGYTRWYPTCAAFRSGGGDAGAGISYDGRTNRVVEKRWNVD